ncbi:Putative FAD-dependent oxidoreductase LodB [Maioricimonas rarisocia]|uniref:FAD-dependent oxidoreductase LodB n=1 Tax=Maioricimonas rarisocia TaxID=2528026 RepID=A0A517Z170_9PLAN|nr:NAD(P)/FAD-dependent oxidoreductase [Maioricimonas rarisocia]QDU36230.1 Putative FAD-dependent oxidoreductase LodB [Maioricimonas rarisocia]
MIQVNYPPCDDFQPEVKDSYDVVVIGGGPAGATTGALLAEKGHSVLILERHPVPRFHVGESLIPETYWTLERLGLIEQLRASAFPKKFSVQFVSDGWKESAPFYFDDMNPHESAQTWQVERGDFDKMLLDNAVAKGATVRTDAHVMDVLFDGETAQGVKVKIGRDAATAEVREIRSKVVADASGQSAFLINRLGLKVPDPHLKKATVWTYWKGAQRDPGKDEGATIVLQTEGKKSWFWYIPLREDIVSVGCTGNLDYMFGGGVSAEEAYNRELERCPALQKRLEKATQHTGYHTTKDYSYKSTQSAGPGWVAVGDASSFVDPVYSSGVHLALKSGEYAADAAHEALEANDLSGERLGAWRAEYSEGVENFRRLVYAFYAPDFSFGDFLRTYPHYKQLVVDILVGNVFKPGFDDMFAAMGDAIPPGSTEPTGT